MKNGYINVLLIAMAAIPVYSQQKMDPRTVLMSRILSHEGSLTEFPSDSSRMSRRKIKAFSTITNEHTGIDVFLTLKEPIANEELKAMGLRNIVRMNDIIVATVPLSGLDILKDNESIKSISVSGAGQLHCDRARKDTGVETVRTGGEGLPQGFDGSGVIVSIYDSGIEPGHLNFLDRERKENRIRGLWHYQTYQNEKGESVTDETPYLTPEEISGFKTDNPDETHGTHTLGIMAGAFGSGGEDSNNDYSGMAPGADILVGCGSVSYGNVARALAHFIEYAGNEEKPLVVNLSLGDNIGPHDGSDAFPRFLNEVGEYVPIFLSSGNEGRTKIALNKTFSTTDNEIKTVIIPRNTIRNYLGASWEAACEVQVWSEDSTPFTIETGLWDKAEERWVFSLPIARDGAASYICNGDYVSMSDYQNDDFDYLYENSAIGVSTGYDPNNGRYTADIWYMLNKQIRHMDRNIVPVLIVRGADGKRVDVYCDGYYNEFGSGKIKGWDEGSGDGTISNIACGENTIAVGAYCTRLILDPSIEGEVSDFTSWGVLPDGRVLPDILAPGDHIVSSMSTPFTESEYFSTDAYPAVYGVMYGEDNPFYWTLLQGTSQASPAMAGIAALWLQANPDLTPAEIKRIAKETARSTSNMTPQCGAGKVDALAGIKEAIKMSDVRSVTSEDETYFLCKYEPDGSLHIEYIFDTEFEVNVFDISGRCVLSEKSTGGVPLKITSEKTGIGMFFIRMKSPENSTARKFLITG